MSKSLSSQAFNFILIMAGSLMLSSCSNTSNDRELSMDGTWLSIGYGQIAQITGGEFIIADITSHSCTPTMDGELTLFGDRLFLRHDTLTLEDGINTYYFTRIEEAPDRCKGVLSDKELNDPIYNFEILGEIFSDHYAYFELREVNWDSLYSATRQKLTSETTDAELYVLMEDMLDSFNDGHIGISAPDEVEVAAEALRTSNIVDEDDGKKTYGDLVIANMIADNYLQTIQNRKINRKSSRNNLINWGIIKDNIGYLQVNVMFGHAYISLPDSLSGNDYWRAYFGHFEEMTSEAHTLLEVAGIVVTLDEAMADLSATDAIILDVRFNGGGKDEVAMEIISRFNSKKHRVFSKKAKLGDGFTQPNHVYLNAADKPYGKPVYLLTSRESASATEIMVLSSLQLDHVTRVGANTEGVFSDVLDKVLPNEWEIGLSNEVYLDTDGHNYEGIGIAPHVDLGYDSDAQVFFRSLAQDLTADKNRILSIVSH